jgi:hypothetical protein
LLRKPTPPDATFRIGTMLFMVVPGTKLGPLNGPNCIPKDPPVETAWGVFDGERSCRRRGPAV